MSIRAITATLVVFAATGICRAANAPNLVRNGSFEQGWEHWERVRDGDACAVREASAPSGERSLQIDLSGDSPIQARVAQRIAVEPGTNYRLSLDANAADRRGGGWQHAGMVVSTSESLRYLRPIVVPNQTGWTPYTAFFHSGENAEMYVVLDGSRGQAEASGSVLFDNVEVVKDEKPDPGWVQRYRTEPRPRWDAWRNALKPRGEPAPPLELAVEGTTNYVIVVPGEPSRQERRAAGELAVWLSKITGAEFPVVADSQPESARELSVGMTNRVTNAERTKLAAAGVEGYAIAVRGERLYLMGPGPMGPLPAVFALLEEDLGVRWYAHDKPRMSWADRMAALDKSPWPLEQYRVPPSPSLAAAIVPRSVEPPVAVRQLDLAYTTSPWGIRNRLSGGLGFRYGQYAFAGGLANHSFHRLVPPEKYFEDHPEYYSLIDSQRRWEGGQLCLSNRRVAEIAADTAIARLKNSAETANWVSVAPMDHRGDCECDACAAAIERTGAYSGLLLEFVNRIAERVEAEVPRGTVTTLIYRQSKQPPEAAMQARGNVALRFCTDFGASFNWPYHSFYDARISKHRALFERWQEISRRMWLWIYPVQYRNYLAPMPSIRPVAENIRFFADQKAEFIFIEQHCQQDKTRAAMRYWVFSKLLLDPALDVEELMLDFIWGYYGQAAPEVVRYHELLWDHCVRHAQFNRERDWVYPIHDEHLYRHGFVTEAREILDQALAAAESDEARHRVELLKAGVVYVEAAQLFVQMRDDDEAPDAECYEQVRNELLAMCERLAIKDVAFHDGPNTIDTVQEFVEAMAKAKRTATDP